MLIVQQYASTTSPGWITLGGDLAGTGTASATPRISTLTGAGGIVSITATTLGWTAGVAAPAIGQLQATAGNGVDMAMGAQAGFGTGVTNGGFVLVKGGGRNSTGNGGGVRLQINNGTPMVEATDLGNNARRIVALCRTAALVSADAPTGDLIVHISNAAVVPSSNPVNGGELYAEAGAGKWRGTGGTITTFGPAEPHCPVCSRDYVFEAQNDARGEHLAICWSCFTDEAEAKGLDVSRFAFHRQLARPVP